MKTMVFLYFIGKIVLIMCLLFVYIFDVGIVFAYGLCS